jgi:hypothetical protein
MYAMTTKPQPKPRKKREKEPAEKPVSLAPLDFETALTGLLKVRPQKPVKATK